MRKPPFLKSGDTVYIVAPARYTQTEVIATAVGFFEAASLKVQFSEIIFERFGQFAGNKQARLNDLQYALDAPHINAIVAAKGGYGTTQLLDELDWTNFKTNPKWLVGFSDLTGLLFSTYHQGFCSIHGTMPSLFSDDPESVNRLLDFLLGKVTGYEYLPHANNINGISEGRLIGGNLSVLVHSIGSSSFPDFKNTILLLEDVDEYLYHIDRMMLQLKRNKVLESLNGIIVGSMASMNDNAIPFGKTAYHIIHDYASEYNFPVCFNAPFGHQKPNLPIIIGSNICMDINQERSLLYYKSGE